MKIQNIIKKLSGFLDGSYSRITEDDVEEIVELFSTCETINSDIEKLFKIHEFNIYNEELINLLSSINLSLVELKKPDDRHHWEDVDVGIYDTLYICKKCKLRHVESIDNSATALPKKGCTG